MNNVMVQHHTHTVLFFGEKRYLYHRVRNIQERVEWSEPGGGAVWDGSGGFSSDMFFFSGTGKNKHAPLVAVSKHTGDFR